MQGFGRNLKIVAAVHILVVVALSVMSGCSWMRRRKAETIVPIEFTVEVPGPVAPDPAPPVEPDPAPPPPKPEPALPKTRPKPKPEPAPRKKPVQTSQARIRRGGGSPRQPTLSAEEIERLLAQGAKPSDHTSIPDADARGFARVRDAFYEVWVQPSRAEAQEQTAEGSIVLGAGGRVVSGRLSRPSGNAILDNSVRRALNAVKQVNGLPKGFVERHREISIAFRVE